ncbi:N-acetylmuramoyl-L-alanine amidase [Paenibacillus terrigena]|uniref:N-acetylmuramoyl-L-alanine amidase n=1 Tax=Paenibacillus terrigena TaxID=369333 RepID=UPI00036DF5F5|nr:N-acetylmuramoyl-L-alanine amidase [Paenibacillus terrigena]
MEYVVLHISHGTACKRRPAYKMTATTITINNTGNPSSTARNERDWLTNPTNPRQASFHIAVDERQAIECPLNENAWHAGDGSGNNSGNRTSIGIEICNSGNYAKTLDNAAELVAKMLKERSWGTDRLRRHFDWSGKICPRFMYDGGRWIGWKAFITSVDAKLNQKEDVKLTEEVRINVNGKKVGVGGVEAGIRKVPIRLVAEALGMNIAWDATTKTVNITTKEAV